jgi:hypothetical protein
MPRTTGRGRGALACVIWTAVWTAQMFSPGVYSRAGSYSGSGQLLTPAGPLLDPYRGAGCARYSQVAQALCPAPASESTAPAVGTGSYPPSCPGWHRPRRLNVMGMPLRTPCSRTASCAYMEHVGSYRHCEGRYGEIVFLYPFKSRTTTRRISDHSFSSALWVTVPS